jgi:hypothetical protein
MLFSINSLRSSRTVSWYAAAYERRRYISSGNGCSVRAIAKAKRIALFDVNHRSICF